MLGEGAAKAAPFFIRRKAFQNRAMNVLNKRQRNVLLVAIILIAATGVYPPWKGTHKTAEVSPVTEYGWIFSPPTPFVREDYWSWEIETSRLIVEWATVLLVGCGLLLLLYGKRSEAE